MRWINGGAGLSSGIQFVYILLYLNYSMNTHGGGVQFTYYYYNNGNNNNKPWYRNTLMVISGTGGMFGSLAN